ncbi:MAG: TlpA family protein disulfide reductase [Chromatiales bacterium]|nr:TlpA family protein disulfide reductase [Chromatiales bacterium]
MRNAVCRMLLAALLILPAACGQGPPPDDLRAGHFFPPLVLEDLSGAHKLLADYQGKLVILNVWATWCPPCRKELPGLQQLQHHLDPQRFVVIGLSVDGDVDFAREYLLEHNIAFENFIDRDAREVRRLLGVRAYPDTFIISPQGVLLRGVIGDRAWNDPAIVAAIEAAYAGDLSGLDHL